MATACLPSFSAAGRASIVGGGGLAVDTVESCCFPSAFVADFGSTRFGLDSTAGHSSFSSRSAGSRIENGGLTILGLPPPLPARCFAGCLQIASVEIWKEPGNCLTESSS